MNRRQKKKAFKKQFGFNPPRNVYKLKNIIAVFKRLRIEILGAWKRIKQLVLNLMEKIKKIYYNKGEKTELYMAIAEINL